MTPTQQLKAEHEAVLLSLRILEASAAALEAGEASAAAEIGELLEFFRVFVDRCHHGKEEEFLFPELERRGVPREGGPVGVMLHEHEIGRAHVRSMASALARVTAGEKAAAAQLAREAGEYSAMLQAHIQKENNILFRMADQVVPPEVAAAMLGDFEAVERDRVGEGKHEAFHAMLVKLAGARGVA
jgi:hemerythrin-like domain-containing protein